MARTLHPLKRPASGKRSSKNKRPRPTPRLDSLAIEVRCDQLRCSILSINRRYCDEAVEILKTRLIEKLNADKVKEIQYLSVDTPSHQSDLLHLFSSLSIKINVLGVGAKIESFDNDDWIAMALSIKKLDTLRISLSFVKVNNTAIIESVIDRCLTMRSTRLEFLEEVRMCTDPASYVDAILVTDAYLLQIAKNMKQEMELNLSTTLLTVEGILAMAEAISARTDAARLRFQLENDAREFKAEILKRWGIKEVIGREFQEMNEPRTTPFVHNEYTMYNEGCESVCVFDGTIVFKFPTEFLLDGGLGYKRISPHRFTIERVIDSAKQLALDRGFFEVKHN